MAFLPQPCRLLPLLVATAAAWLGEGGGSLEAQESVPLRADERAAIAQGNGLPAAVAASHFEVLMVNSPFTRSLNLSDSLILTGIATMDGKQVATLMNKETKETYVVSDQPNPQGWKMVEVSGTEAIDKVAAKISVTGGEVVTVRYAEWALKPGEAKPATGGGGEVRESEGRRREEGGRGFRGPPPEIRAKMEALPEEKRQKLFDHMMKLRMEKPDMSWEERGKEFQKALDRLEKSK
jgi:hypothetical protein